MKIYLSEKERDVLYNMLWDIPRAILKQDVINETDKKYLETINKLIIKLFICKK